MNYSIKDFVSFPNAGSFNSNLNPSCIIVILHGYGDSANGIIPLSHEIQPYIPGCLCIAPNAPLQHESGLRGAYQWFGMGGFPNGRFSTQLESASDAFVKFISKILSTYNLTEENLVIVGFSQGAILSLYMVCERDLIRPKAVVAYAGMLMRYERIKSYYKMIGERGKVMSLIKLVARVVYCWYMGKKMTSYLLMRVNWHLIC